jgi:acyl-CoA synthetase (AMP-forming)/AMP-acid ligase II
VLAATIAEVLAPALAEDPARPALVAPDLTLSYAELDAAGAQAAGALRELGVRPGDRIGVGLPNDSAIVVLFHAAMRLGAVWVGISQQLAPPEQAALLDHCQPSLTIGVAGARPDAELPHAERGQAGRPGPGRVLALGPAEWADAVRAARPVRPAPVDPGAPAAIAYTSGTTGHPKGVVHSQHNLLVPGAVLVATRGYDSSLRKADSLPMTIINLLVLSTLLASQARGTAVISDARRAQEVVRWLRATRATVWNGVPALLYDMAGDPAIAAGALDGLTEVWSGGDSLSEEIRAAFCQRFSPPLAGTYGLTEAPTVVAIEDRGAPHRPGCSGRVLPHLSVREDPDGELCVGGRSEGPWAGLYTPMLEYLDNPEATAQALRDGVLRTGDVGRVSERGEVFVTDRRKLVIVRGGANVYPAEVERIIAAYRGVRACAVFGTPDERLGARISAVVEAQDAGLDLDGLRLHCRERLARYKVPEDWQVTTDSLPRNAMGKLDRLAIAARLVI